MLKHTIDDGVIAVETSKLHARIRTQGYVSGVAAGSLVDKATGALPLGFGLQIADFLLEPGKKGEDIPEGQYQYGSSLPAHGEIPKRYVEGPQICTKAGKLPFEVIEGEGFLAIKQWFTFTQGYGQYRPGSQWEQLLIFPEDTRYYLGSDRITSANDCPALVFRQDIPGHVKHDQGNSFEHVLLSYEDAWLPSTEFLLDFAPDEKYLYQQGQSKMPKHFFRAYQPRIKGEVGPWLGGITLNPPDVYQAWCHQRGYVCMIQEIGGHPVQAGDTFGAAYAIGWFQNVAELSSVAQKYAGVSGFALEGTAKGLAGFRTLKQDSLPPVDRPKPSKAARDS